MRKTFLLIVVFASLASKAFSQGPVRITKENWINCEVVEENQGWYCGATCYGKNKILGKQGNKCAYEENFYNYNCNNNKIPSHTYTKCLFSQEDVNKIIANNLKIDKSSCTVTKEACSIEECVIVKSFHVNSSIKFSTNIKDCKPYKKDFTFRSLFFYEEIVGYHNGKCIVKSIEQIDNKRKQVECRLSNVQQNAFYHLGRKEYLSLIKSIEQFENNKEACETTFLEPELLNSNNNVIEEKASAPTLW